MLADNPAPFEASATFAPGRLTLTAVAPALLVLAVPVAGETGVQITPTHASTAVSAAPAQQIADRAAPLTDADHAVAVADSMAAAVRYDVAQLVQRYEPGVWRVQQSGQGSGGSRLATCRSKTKGVLIGAAIGAASGGALAAVLNRRDRGRTFVSFSVKWFAVGGAGVGALVGLEHCR